MKRPTITHAKRICQELGARGVIVLVFDVDDFQGVSYGETRLECSQLGQTLDVIVNEISDGVIQVWQ